MKRLIIPIGILFTMCFFGCDNTKDPEKTQLEQEYEIYLAYLNSLADGLAVVTAESNDGLARINIQESYLDYAIENFSIDADVVRDIPAANEEQLIFDERLEASGKDVQVVAREEWVETLPPGLGYTEYWEQFVEVYGESAYRVAMTRIAFNADMTKAAFGAASGSWSYLGTIVYAEKERGVWEIKEVATTWTN